MRNSLHVLQAEAEQKERLKLKLDESEELPNFVCKKILKKILARFRVIVTTCGTSSNSRVLFTKKYFEFKRVLMDEATMIKECDSVVPMKNCKQLVLIGDQNQLGPNYEYVFEGPQSLFNRLIATKNAKSCFLDIQYRMSESLIKVSNDCFYDRRIKTGYLRPPLKKFLNLESPFVFIDVPGQNELFDDTSAFNEPEIGAVLKFLRFWLGYAHRSATQQFQPNEIAIITPYAA
jgi:superfamily I DNA and/or RNA helicase